MISYLLEAGRIVKIVVSFGIFAMYKRVRKLTPKGLAMFNEQCAELEKNKTDESWAGDEDVLVTS